MRIVRHFDFIDFTVLRLLATEAVFCFFCEAGEKVVENLGLVHFYSIYDI